MASHARPTDGTKQHLLVDLLVGNLGSLGLLGVDEIAEPSQGLVADNNGSGNSGLALGDEALLVNLLVLGSIDLEDVVFALDALLVRQENQATGLGEKLRRGLLDDREALVDALERLFANGVGPLEVGGHIAVRLGEPGKDRTGEGLVGSVAELE